MSGIDLQGVFFGSQKSGMFGCGGSTTAGIAKDVAEETTKVDVPQDAKGEVPFLDVYNMPKVCTTNEAFSNIWEFYEEEVRGTMIPIVKDLNRDGFPEIIVIGESHYSPSYYDDALIVYVLSHQGKKIPGWPQVIGEGTEGVFHGYHNPMEFVKVGDINGDGKSEIVIMLKDPKKETKGPKLFARSYEGNNLVGWPVLLEDHKTISSLAMGDINNDQALEVIAYEYEEDDKLPSGYYKSTLHAWQGNGKELPGWPLSFDVLSVGINSPIAVADLDGDKIPEILTNITKMVYPEIQAWKFDGTQLPDFPVEVESKCATLLVGDLDNNGGLDIICVKTWSNSIDIYDNKGKHLSSIKANSPDYAALGDLDNNGELEVVFRENAYSSPFLSAYKWDGTPLSGWPIHIPYDTGDYETFLIGDVDGSPGQEVIVNASFGFAYIYGKEVNLLYTLDLETSFYDRVGDAVLTDSNSDGLTDMIISRSAQSNEWLVNISAGTFCNSAFTGGWPMYGHDPQGTWNYETPIE